MIVDKINNYLSSEGKSIKDVFLDEFTRDCRGFMNKALSDRLAPRIRVSNVGDCVRKLWYIHHGYPIAGKEIDARGSMVFLYGDITEALVTTLARLAGVNLGFVGKNQLEVDFNGLKGHPDGLLIDEKVRLFECKSMTDYSFNDFEKGIIDIKYLVQVHSYMHALGLDECVFVALNKVSGVLNERILKKDMTYVSKGKMNKLVAESENIPEPEFSVGKNRFYPWQCCYCSHWKHCRPNAELVLVGKANKLREKKEKDNGKL